MLVMMVGCSGGGDSKEGSMNLARLSWLLGRWEVVEEDHTLCEEWQRVDSTTFRGFGCRITGGDTTITEKLEIRVIGDEVYYIADVPQNPEPVMFLLTRCTDTTAVFENPEHDLPNQISYQFNAPGIIRVLVTGVRDGTPTGFELLFARVAEAGVGEDSITP